MIARIPPDRTDAIHSDAAAFLDALPAAGFRGEIGRTHGHRTVLATDNSIYQRLPQAVVYPRDADDLQRIARLAGDPNHRSVTLAPRGGGTGTNGQSLTNGIVIDTARHMNRILAIDPARRRVRVEAGVVKDQLNAALRPHGLFFAPELSTSNRATIGGMVATDASGQGSCEYGKTRDHVLSIDAFLIGGERLTAEPVEDEDLGALCGRDDAIGRIYRCARTIHDEQRALIDSVFPPLNRCLTGYDLAHLRDDRGRLDLSSLLCGAEGTLALTSEITLNVLPIPAHTALVNIRYAGFMDALRDARPIMDGDAEPTSVETVDETVLALAREDFIWTDVAEFFPDGVAAASGINLVEFNDDNAGRLSHRIERFCRQLSAHDDRGRIGYTVADRPEAIRRIYAMRKRAVGLLGNASGEARPVAFVEDTAVPPEHLASYVSEFRDILDARGLSYGMFGHVDAGVLHVRPALDLKDPAQEGLVREVSDAVAALTRRYNGLLWGEHGKGVRSEYAPAFFGALYPCLRQIKAAFDPHNQLNPGKIATPAPAPAPGDHVATHDPGLDRIDGVTTRGQLDRTIPAEVRALYPDALHCNGNGACYNYDVDDPMCPSWKATRDRIHSPKGRAGLMREWLRLQQAAGVDLAEQTRRRRREGPMGFLGRLPQRLANTRAARRGEADFSHEVHQAMAGCLACNACGGQCPVKVSVPGFRAAFLELYHDRYLRPLRDYFIAGLEALLPIMARVAPLYNAVVRSDRVQGWMQQRIGLADPPRLSRRRLARDPRWRLATTASPSALARLGEEERRRSVILVQDAFTTHFEAELVGDTIELLTRLGAPVYVARYRPAGKPLHVHGFLGAFRRTASRQARYLRSLAASGVPLVGIDPAMTLIYRKDYPQAIGEEAAPGVSLLPEWLGHHLAELDIPDLSDHDPGFRLLGHCTEKTGAPTAIADWQRVFGAFGLALDAVATGCCGMSGTYGHESRNLETSRIIYGQSWRGVVEAPQNRGRLLATGYSCRSQVRRLSDRDIPHPLQGLLALIRETGARAYAEGRLRW